MSRQSTERVSCDDERPVSRAESRPTEAVIELAALSRNLDVVRRHADGRDILAVVKAGAYGHGAVAVARHMSSLGVGMLGVATIEEGRELRAAAIELPILVMGVLLPEQADAVIASRLVPIVTSLRFAEALSAAAGKYGVRAQVHVKIDTGMGRIGVSSDDAVPFIEALSALPGIQVQGLMTHFADADLRDKKYAEIQMDRFERLLAALEGRGFNVPIRHAANSAAVLDYRRALFTMVRPGLMLYGYSPLEDPAAQNVLSPALTLRTKVAYLKRVATDTPISYGRTHVTRRESMIATIPIGYADGYSRFLSNKGEALVQGRRAPVVGRVCMDMCMLDVTDVPGVREGDDVILIGRQGGESITAVELAEKIGTIPYEVLCGISSRVPRFYQ